MPSLETVEVPLLPGEAESMANEAALVAAATAPDAKIDDDRVHVMANSSSSTNKTATSTASSALKRKITPSSERSASIPANSTSTNATNNNNNKRKKSNQKLMLNFFGKPSTTLTPQMTASAKKKTSASKNGTATSTSKTKTTKAAAAGTDKTATVTVSKGGSKGKSNSQQKEPSSEQLTTATATATETETTAEAETKATATSTSELEKIRKAELRSIVMGRSFSSARKINVKLLEKFDQDDPSSTETAAEVAGVEEDTAGPEESSDETTIATITPTIATAGSTSSYDLDNDNAEKSEVELDTNDSMDGDGESSKKQVASAAVPPSGKDSEHMSLEVELEDKKSADTSADEPSTAPGTMPDAPDAPEGGTCDADPSTDKAVDTTSDDNNNNNNNIVEQQSTPDEQIPKTTEESKKEASTLKIKAVTKARSGSKGSAKDEKSPSIMSFLQSKTASSSSKKKTEAKENKTTEPASSTAKPKPPPVQSKTISTEVSNGKKKTKPKKSVVSNSTAADTSTVDASSEPAPTETEPMPTALSDESQALLKKHETMRAKYCARANALLGLLPQGLDEENFSIPVAEKAEIPSDASMEGGDFPDFAVNTLAALVEGSRLPLSALAQVALSTLNTMHDTDSFRLESTTAKIKLLATRVKYIKNPSLITKESSTQSALSTDLFEDENENHMWRWEVATIDFLPQESIAQVKKARSARRKASIRVNALARLLAALNDADKLLLDAKTSKEKLGKAAAKISQEEEKALKFEREDEKARLENEIKKKKEEGKVAEQKKKELESKEKEHAAEEKRKEKQLKKAEVTKAQLKKSMDLEEKQKKENRLKEAKEAELNRQKGCMKSFFGARKPAKKQEPKAEKVEVQVETKKEIEAPRQASGGGFDAETFRSEIDLGKAPSNACPFASVSTQAKQSRKRNTKKVAVSVFVTVMPDNANAFEAQPFAERQDVMVQNKYKFLRFHEDCRPPYHGTWSKSSSIVKGKNPFAKDTTYLEYDYDSEAEWEEGDEEAGEDVENDMGDEEEENEEEEGDLNEDGWLAADDEIEDELDEETKMLRKQQVECGDATTHNNGAELTACLIAPMNGIPLTEIHCKIGLSHKSLVEGLDFKKGYQLLEAHQNTTLNDFDIWLDAFPPALIEEDAATHPDQSASDGTKSSGQEMSSEDMKTFARFVHLCTLGSKDKVVDELRSTHESVTSSRAQAIRVLDSIADKKKLPNNSVCWEVKKELLEKLGLEDLVAKTADVGLDADGATQENKKKVALFVHHCTISSKEKVVDELRSTLESATASRADAMRMLESVAEKKKDSANGVYWEVKKEVRDELGLHNLPTSPPPSTTETTKETPKPAPLQLKKVQTTAQKEKRNAEEKQKGSGKKRAALSQETTKATPLQLEPVQTTAEKEKRKAEEKQNSSGKKRKALIQENTEAPKQNSSKKKASPKPSGSAGILASFLQKDP
jgi:chromatin assembly factor 1 subunit A